MSVFCPDIKSPVWIKHTELVGNDLNYLSWIGNKGYPMELNSKGKPSTLYADLVKEYKDEKLAARIKALTFSKSIMEKLGDVKKDSKGEYKLEDVKKILTLSKEPISQIKLGVSELFESNPELANEVYEALGLTTINESEITYTDEEGNPCAKMGLTNTVKGTNWKIVKDFKGKPKHSQGGVDITISNDGVSMRRDGKDIKAKYGLLITNNI